MAVANMMRRIEVERRAGNGTKASLIYLRGRTRREKQKGALAGLLRGLMERKEEGTDLSVPS